MEQETGNNEKGSLELNYKGDMEKHLSEYFDSRIEILEWHVKNYQRDIERAKERIKEHKQKKHSLDGYDEDWDAKIQSEEQRITNCKNIIKEHLYEPIGWLYEIKHEIMKID